MNFGLGHLVVGACSALVMACATDTDTRNELRTHVVPLAVRPRLLLHASDDPEQRVELGRSFGNFLRGATEEDLALLATCEVECVSSRELAGLGLEVTDTQLALVEPGEPAVVLVRGRLPRANAVASVFAENDGAPVSARERFAATERPTQLAREFFAKRLVLALGPGSPAFARGCARELVLCDEALTETGAFESEVPLDERAQSAPFHLAVQAAQRPAALAALATYARERWIGAAPRGSEWVNTNPAWDFPAHVELVFYCVQPRVTNRDGQELHILGAEELAADPSRE